MTMYVEYINFLKLSGANHVKVDDDDDMGKRLCNIASCCFLMHVLKVFCQSSCELCDTR